MFEKSGLGVTIGSLYVTIGSLYLGAPICADDILLIANTSFQSQAMLDLRVNYSIENKYSIHPVKSTIIHYIKLKREATSHIHYHLGDKPVNNTVILSFGAGVDCGPKDT